MKMKVAKELILEVCESSTTMTEAHCKLGLLKFDTFRKYAKALDVWKPNCGNKGGTKLSIRTASTYYTELGNPITSHRLKLKLISEGIKLHQCEICNMTTWNGLPIPIELDHIDGNHFNNKLDNLRIICPNCHAQTDTHAGKRLKKK